MCDIFGVFLTTEQFSYDRAATILGITEQTSNLCSSIRFCIQSF